MLRKLLLLIFVCCHIFVYADSDHYQVKVGELVTVRIPSEWENRLWGINKTFRWNVLDQTALKLEDNGFNYCYLRGLREAPNQQVTLTVNYGNGNTYTYKAIVSVETNSSSGGEALYFEVSPNAVILEPEEYYTFSINTNCEGGLGNGIEDEHVALIPQFRKVYAFQPGKTKYTAWCDDNYTNQRYSASADVIVSGIVPSVYQIQMDCASAEEVSVDCYGKIGKLIWSAPKELVLVPNGTKCTVFGRNRGYYNILVEDDKGHSATISCKVTKELKTISPNAPIIYLGSQRKVSSSLDGPLQWGSDDSSIASVDSEGIITGHRVGTTYVFVCGYKDGGPVLDCICIEVIEKDDKTVLEDVEFVDYFEDYHFITGEKSIVYIAPIPSSAKLYSNISLDLEPEVTPMISNLSAGRLKVFWYSNNVGKFSLTYVDGLESISKTAYYEYHPKNEIGVPDVQYSEIEVGQVSMIYPTGLTPNSLLNLSEVTVDNPAILSAEPIKWGNFTTSLKVTGLKEGKATVSFLDGFSNDYGKIEINVKAPGAGVENISSDEVTVNASNGAIFLSRQTYVELYDITGCIIYKGETNQIDHLTAGIYILVNGTTVHKIMVK